MTEFILLCILLGLAILIAFLEIVRINQNAYKYIKKVDDPQQELWDELMKEGN